MKHFKNCLHARPAILSATKIFLCYYTLCIKSILEDFPENVDKDHDSPFFEKCIFCKSLPQAQTKKIEFDKMIVVRQGIFEVIHLEV